MCVLTPTSCTVTETLNGEYEVLMEHPRDEGRKWTYISEGCILKVPVPSAMTPNVNLRAEETETEDVVYYEVHITTAYAAGRSRIYSKPTTNSKVLAYYQNGDEVVFLGMANNDWRIVMDGKGVRGYMSAKNTRYKRTVHGKPGKEGVPAVYQQLKPKQVRAQLFRIYRVVPDLQKIKIYARHIFYDLLDNMIKKIEPSSSTLGATVVGQVGGGCLSPHDFTFYSDLETTAEDVAFENINPVEALLGDSGVSEKYAGELARDWWDVYMVKRVGLDTNVQIREGKNLLGVSYDVDTTGVVTRFMPTGEDKDGNIIYLPETHVDSEHLGEYLQPKWAHLAVQDAKESDDKDEPMTLAQCYESMRKACKDEFAKGCDLPTVTLNVDFINLCQTEEYKKYDSLQNIYLGDSVWVHAPNVGVDAALRMTAYTFDCLTTQYTDMTLGTVADMPSNGTITGGQIANGSIGGIKLGAGAVGAGQMANKSIVASKITANAIQAIHLGAEVVVADKLAAESVTAEKIATGVITADKMVTGTLDTTILNAVKGEIERLVSGEITTDELYANIAEISYAQITTANINKADIKWADIATLKAVVAEIANANIGTADIDFAKIKDLVAGTAIIEKGIGGKLFIKDLAVTDANIVNLTVGELLVKGADGGFYALSVGKDGEVVTTAKKVVGDDVDDASISGGKLVENTITARELNVASIFADEALIGAITAKNIDVVDLVASEVFTSSITSNDVVRLFVEGVAQGFSIIQSPTPPTDLADGVLWLDMSENVYVLKRWDIVDEVGQWVVVNPQTDWTEVVEDLQDDIAQLVVEKDSISATVKATQGDIVDLRGEQVGIANGLEGLEKDVVRMATKEELAEKQALIDAQRAEMLVISERITAVDVKAGTIEIDLSDTKKIVGNHTEDLKSFNQHFTFDAEGGLIIGKAGSTAVFNATNEEMSVKHGAFQSVRIGSGEGDFWEWVGTPNGMGLKKI